MSNILIIVFLIFLILILNVSMNPKYITQHFGGSSITSSEVENDHEKKLTENISKININNSNITKQNILKLNNKKKKSISFNPKIKVRFFDKQSRQILYDQTSPI